MATFRYIARTARGKSINSSMVADNKGAVISNLRSNGLVPVKVTRQEARSPGVLALFNKRVKAESIVIFSRQLATMIDAGIPLVQGLDALQLQVNDPNLTELIKTLKEDVEGGSSLSEALEKHPRAFGSFFVNLVRAGENSGTLAEIMNRIATYLEYTRALKRKVKSAMMYPAVISIMALIVTIVLLVKVIPVFGVIYESFGSELPLPTALLLRFSDILRRFMPVVIACFVGLGLILRWYYGTDGGRLIIDRLKFRIPVFGDLIKKVILSRFSRTLSTLVHSGVPILQSLDIVSKTAGNYAVELAVREATRKIKEGESIAVPLEETGIFPPMVVRMIAIGEKTGKVDTMLEKLADFFDEQVNTTLAGLTALVEPLLIGVLGVVIGTIVICMFLPILRLSSIINI